jgi:YetA-like protein
MIDSSSHLCETADLSIPLLLDSTGSCPVQPITIGLPFPRGSLLDSSTLRLLDTANALVSLQTEPLAHWSDGSIQWLLLDYMARNLQPGQQTWRLVRDVGTPTTTSAGCQIVTQDNAISIDTGSVACRLGKSAGQPLLQVIRSRRESDLATLRVAITDKKGAVQPPSISRAEIESSGPVRTTVRIETSFGGRSPCRLIVRVCNFLDTGLVRLRLTIHNPRRARHRGGLWDLGDSGSIFFDDLSVVISLRDSELCQIRFKAAPGESARNTTGQEFEIYQDSSGGENWQSRNHVNRFGRVPCTFRGFRVRTADGETKGLRANPVVLFQGARVSVTVAVPEFWQQFPKAIEYLNGAIHLRLFPAQFADTYELQGGEQKTHTIWMNFGPPNGPETVLDWVHQPADVRATSEWYSASGAFPEMAPPPPHATDRFENYLAGVINGPTSLLERREIIDEFGWRNFGDIYADHENAFYTGAKPVVSHFNNQFDPLFGSIFQYARSGDSRWRSVSDPLARHVIDIDIYHTEQDRAAYRGGLFWMTDHYLDAATSTHRTYSRKNRSHGQSQGGGPGSSHNFTTGLLYYYYLTGDPLGRDAVISLADWVQRMDDGRLNVLSLIDQEPTGLASFTADTNYHGPGRGAGLSVNSQIDAWLLTGWQMYRDKAEQLIRRCIHPADDVAALDLLNAELRWSYPVFLVALARYLRCKAEANELDHAYAYGRASMLHYAVWMLEHEQPFLSRRNQLQYPTETWAAQEFRKANAMRLAADHADEPLRQRLLRRATELTDTAWEELSGFATSHTSRAVAILLTEGTRDQYYRTCDGPLLPAPAASGADFGRPISFVNQKQRVKRLMKSPWRLLYRVAGSVVRRLGSRT